MTPCYASEENVPHLNVGRLKISGLDGELALRGMSFDDFQTHLLHRMRLRQAKGHRDSIYVKPTVYPCLAQPHGSAKKGGTLKIWVPTSPDLYINEIAPIHFSLNEDDQVTLAAVVVKPSDSPIHFRIEEDGSKNVKYVFPIRKPGMNSLEEDWQRIQEYIQSHFQTSLVDKIVDELAKHFSHTHLHATEPIAENIIADKVREYSEEWGERGFPYNLVEEYGKSVKAYTRKTTLWESESDKKVLAFLLMVSLHYNAGWDKWTMRNAENERAISALFETFHTDYWRTRFRALYALQFMNQANILHELSREQHSDISPNTVKVIRELVPKMEVVSFIKQVSLSASETLVKKAKEVLAEIGTIWNDKSAGIESPL